MKAVIFIFVLILSMSIEMNILLFWAYKELKSSRTQEKKCCRMIPLEHGCDGRTDIFICTNCHQHIHLGFIRKVYSGSYCLNCGAEVIPNIRIKKRNKSLYTMNKMCKTNGVEASDSHDGV